MAGERGVEEFEMSLERTQARCPRHGKDGKLGVAGKNLSTAGGAAATRELGPTPSVPIPRRPKAAQKLAQVTGSQERMIFEKCPLFAILFQSASSLSLSCGC